MDSTRPEYYGQQSPQAPNPYPGSYPMGHISGPGQGMASNPMMPYGYPGGVPGRVPGQANPPQKSIQTPEDTRWGRIALAFIAVIGILFIVAIVVAFLTPTNNNYDDGDFREIGKVISMVDQGSGGKVIRSIVVASTDYHNFAGVWASTDPLQIKVYDKEGNPLSGCTVSVQGCNATGTSQTDYNGVATFDGFTYSLPIGTQAGHVSIAATRSSYGDMNSQIPVVRGESGMYDTYA